MESSPHCTLVLGILLPIFIIVACNLRIVNIAKYHQFRIANALFGMTLSAHHNVEGAKARERQNIALKRFQGLNAIITLSQLVGSLLFFYLPFVTMTLYESWSGNKLLSSYNFIPRGCLVLLMINPVCSGFIFGIKNKSLQSSILNFARKEIYKSEVQQEIRLRSPGGGGLGTSRPSFGSFVSSLGQVTSQMPYLQRHLSELCLNSSNNGAPPPPMNGGNNLPRRSAGSCRRVSGQESGSKPKPFKRHASDLTWRMSAAGLSCPRFNSVVDMSVLSATSIATPIPNEQILLRSNSSLLSPPVSSSNNDNKFSSVESGTENTSYHTNSNINNGGIMLSSSITDTEDEIDVSQDSDVPGCKSVRDFNFPKDPTLQVKWRVAINLCHEHFKQEDYNLPGGRDPDVPRLRKCLKKGPSIFSYRRSTDVSFREERHRSRQKPKEVNPTQDYVKVIYFDDSVIEVEIEDRDSKEEHMEDLFLSIKTLANDSEAVRFYTGFYDFDQLIYFSNWLGPAATNLKYKSKRSPLKECVLTLVKLRRNIEDLELPRFFLCF
ncbi:unnamed protein product [Lepeophtheirus salmonis]|uniref:(salmon louse) hypothetical protein n=1 Tax=Lepeophtheirus salmonis TaxID=72036 RepID=A0A7R8H261_LEPSM|nr:unnamed protein product [Lepeophtheirus salmonis]CAF2823430.1 unnamed protein product [Lepeophtheirus salmonis]